MTPAELRRELFLGPWTHLFLDLDDTLLESDSLPLFCRYLLRQNWHRVRFHRQVSLSLVMAAGRLRPPASFKAALAKFFEGRRRQDLRDLGRDFAAGVLLGRVRPELRRTIRAAKELEIKVVIATASLDLYCQPLSEELGADTLLSTELEYQEGRCTGRLATANCKGEEKLSRVRSFCAQHGLEPDRSAFLSDHESDIPCFELVGMPVMVRPTRRLRAFGQANGFLELAL